MIAHLSFTLTRMDSVEMRKRTKQFGLRIMKLTIEGDLLPETRVSELLDEADQLCKILYSTQRSSRENDKS